MSFIFRAGLALLACLFIVSNAGAQSVLANAVPTIQLQGGGATPMNVAYDPVLDRYYSTTGGFQSVPAYTHDGAGNLLATTQPLNNDNRSIFYNPNTNAIELISFNAVSGGSPDGLMTAGRDGAGILTGSNTAILAALPGLPGSQTMPAYDPIDDVFYARESGNVVNIVRRSDGGLQGQITLDVVAAGGASLNNNTIGFDVTERVLVVLDNGVSPSRALVFDLAGSFIGASALPPGSPSPGSYGVGYANGQLFVSDNNSHFGYRVLQGGSVDLSITKTAPATAVAGTQITYTFDVSNSASAGTFSPVAANFTDISATGTPVGLSDDQVSGDIPLPFTFDFQGQAKNDIRISSNGFLTFAPQTNNGCCSGQPIPNAATPNDVIAFFWVDLNPAAGGEIDYQTLGTAPNRQFIVQFTGVPHFGGGGGPVTAQAILYEGSNDIEFQYVSAPPDGSPTTVGIENADGTIALQIANSAVSYSNEGFLIQQQSPATATGVTVTDSLPAGTTFVSASGCTNAPSGPVVSCDLPDVAPGGSVNASITVSIDPSFTGTLDNTASVASDQGDGDPSNNSSTASTTVGAEADMAIVKTGPATAIAGTQVTYDITVTNNGPSDAQSVQVADPTPAGYTFA
ncbi:DUF11 domain-containing protein, partial [Halomonas denitrificans]|nr:DUF11 domain-containing protein [Halomonas denitrificans]